MKLRYTPDALGELRAVLGGIGVRSPQGAARVAASMRRAEQTLLDYPLTGILTTARLPPVRRIVVRPFPYILFYELDGGEIRIIAVRHGARDPSSMPGQS